MLLRYFAPAIAGTTRSAKSDFHSNCPHHTDHAALKALEYQLGIVLLDRDVYPVVLTAEGAAFHTRAVLFLRRYDALRREAAQLAAGEEPELRVVVGDLCPLPETLGMLRRFFPRVPASI